MLQRDVEVMNANGIHARPAAEIVKCAGRYRAHITLARDGMEVNGKSIMGVMMLAAARGSTLVIEADGPDEEQAVEAMRQLIAEGFGEELA